VRLSCCSPYPLLLHSAAATLRLLLLQDVNTFIDYSAASAVFDATRPSHISAPKSPKAPTAPTPASQDLLAALEARKRCASSASTMTDLEIQAAKARGAAQRSAAKSALAAKTAAIEANLRLKTKAERAAHYESTVCATAEDVAAEAAAIKDVSSDDEFAQAHAQALAEIAAKKAAEAAAANNANANASNTIKAVESSSSVAAMRPSDDLQPCKEQQDDQEDSSYCAAAAR
jgi:hypothetical protein